MNFTIMPFFQHKVIQGNWNIGIASYQAMNYYYQNGGVDGDELNYEIFLAAGTYTFRFMGMEHDTRGIFDLTIDGIVKGSIDTYNSSFGENYIASITGATVATSGVADVNVKINGKNASSSGYYLSITSFAMWRTA